MQIFGVSPFFQSFFCSSLLYVRKSQTRLSNNASVPVSRCQSEPCRPKQTVEGHAAVLAVWCPCIDFRKDWKEGVYKQAQSGRLLCEPVWPTVKRWAGKQKDLGSIPLRLSFLFKKVVVCGHCLVTLSITSYWNIKMALIAAHLNAEIILVVTM